MFGSTQTFDKHNLWVNPDIWQTLTCNWKSGRKVRIRRTCWINNWFTHHNYLIYASSRVEFLLKTDSGYPKDTGVNKPWQPLGIPFAITHIITAWSTHHNYFVTAEDQLLPNPCIVINLHMQTCRTHICDADSHDWTSAEWIEAEARKGMFLFFVLNPSW